MFALKINTSQTECCQIECASCGLKFTYFLVCHTRNGASSGFKWRPSAIKLKGSRPFWTKTANIVNWGTRQSFF